MQFYRDDERSAYGRRRYLAMHADWLRPVARRQRHGAGRGGGRESDPP